MSHTEQLLREALESIVACCDESNTARDYASRQTEIAGIARYALTQTEDGFEGRCPTCLCTTVCNDCAEMGVMDSDLKKYGDPAALSQPAQPAVPEDVSRDAERWVALSTAIVESLSREADSDEMWEHPFLAAFEKAIGDHQGAVTLEQYNAWADAARAAEKGGA